MRRTTARISLTLALSSLLPPPLPATCGGGGGGGIGGVDPHDLSQPEVYRVPWKVLSGGSQPEASDSGLALLWFPVSRDEARMSQLLDSRYLTVSFAPCGGLWLVPSDGAALRAKYAAVDGRPIAVLAGADGAELARAEGEKGSLRISAVEKLVKSEVEKRRGAVEGKLDEAAAKQKAGEVEAAKALYQEIYAERCLLPGSARKAQRALKKMGVELDEAAALDGGPDLATATDVAMREAIAAGLAAEFDLRLDDARRAYDRAHELDPADPVALRFLAEYHRHHSGDWKLARELFQRILDRPADALSRAVALHGLGKMTIHAGEFAKGVGLIEQSVATFPLPLAYRNLAVYWNSEGRFDKAYEYVEKALELAPDELYNRIFAATYFVGLGKPEEAERVAREHHDLLEASYNLAAIWAQLGDREQALDLLTRHFYQYERFDPVRAREMREARDDVAFGVLREDPRFVELTRLADADFESFHVSKAAR